jgi:HAD superfamily hydrolase (TIGR01509 family)
MLFPRLIEAVLFDMDGLLVDTESVYRDAVAAEAAARGHPMPLSLLLQMPGLPEQACDELARSHFGQNVDISDYSVEVTRRVMKNVKAGVALKDRVIELLDLLDKKNLPRAIVTSSSHKTLEACLGSTGILPRFNAVIACDDYARGKPHPDPFLRGAEVLAKDPARCLVLEDSYNGVRAAHAAGMITIMVPDLLGATDEMRELCHAIPNSLHAVRHALSARLRS